MPSTSMILMRLDAPVTMRTWERGRPASSAKNRTHSSLALPSAGGARMCLYRDSRHAASAPRRGTLGRVWGLSVEWWGVAADGVAGPKREPHSRLRMARLVEVHRGNLQPTSASARRGPLVRCLGLDDLDAVPRAGHDADMERGTPANSAKNRTHSSLALPSAVAADAPVS